MSPTTRYPDYHGYDVDGYPTPPPLRPGRTFAPGCDHAWVSGRCWRCGGIHHHDEEDAA